MQDLVASEPAAATPGALAEVDARSLARPDPVVTTRTEGSLLFPGDPTVGLVAEQTWQVGPPHSRSPLIDVRLRGVGALALDLIRAGFAPGEAGTVDLATDGAVALSLRGLTPTAVVRIDGVPTGSDVTVAKGHHSITFGPA